MRIRPLLASLTAAAAAIAVLAGCGGPAGSADGGGSSGSGSTKLALVGYSTPKEAYADLIPAFQKSAGGQGVSFTQSFGASGDQSRAVAAGLPADVVALSLAPDVQKLADAGLVARDWQRADDHGGFVTNSVAVIGVRKGNPKHIQTWDDLVRPGVKVLTPNPFTSGGAKWNLMAAYGAQVEQGRTAGEALAYVSKLLQHVPVQDKSGRESLQTFLQGQGDAVITYENEALTAQAAGQSIDYVIPDQTILIQNPVAVVARSQHLDRARAFVAWLRGAEAQRIFAGHGYRPVVASLVDSGRFPTPPGLFKIDDLGGWRKVNDEFFDPDKGSVAKIEEDLGVSTAR